MVPHHEYGYHALLAPEVYDQSYNCRADVYSFGVLFWYILALKKQEKDFIAQVVLGGARPTIKRKWPESVRFVLESAWKKNPTERIDMGQIKTILRDTIFNCGADSSDMLNTSRRRSTFIFGSLKSSGSYTSKGSGATKAAQRLATIEQTQSESISV